MPGIAGIVSPQERERLPALLSTISSALRFRTHTTIHTWSGDFAGLAAAGNRPEAALVERDGVTLALAGRIVPDETLAERARRAGSLNAPQNTPDCLLELYLRLGPQALQGLNGIYTAAIWDARRQRLEIIGDRYGMQPLVYWHQGSRFVFATYARAVASHPAFCGETNPTAVLDLLAAEQMLDERTLFAGAQSIPPAAYLTFEDGQLCVESYWQPRISSNGGYKISPADALEGLAEHLQCAVSRQIESISGRNGGPDVCLLLTGGLDSRLLAGMLTGQVDPGQAVAATIGHKRARDVRYGSEIARVAGIAHTLLPSNPHYLSAHAAEAVRRTEGGLNVHAAWILGASQYLTETHIPAVMTGVGAEFISGRNWLSEQPVVTRQEAFERLSISRWGYPRAAALLHPRLRADAYAASRESLRRTLEEAPGEHLLGWADYFAFRQQRRHPTGSILAEDTQVLEPFYDNDLIDFALRLPADLRNKGLLYKRLIVETFPDLARIGYTDSGQLLSEEMRSESRLRGVQAWLQTMQRRVARRAARQLPLLRPLVPSDNPGHAIYYNTWLRTASRDFVEKLVTQDQLYGDVLDAQRVKALVEDHMTGRDDQFRLINAVLTFILWRMQTA